jgi:hypothetical protein
MNLTRPCAPSPCDPGNYCNVYGGHIAMCDPCSGPININNLLCRPECLAHSDCPFNLACLGRKCHDPCPGSCGVNANCMVVNHNPVCSCPTGLVGNPFEHCSTPPPSKYNRSTLYIIHFPCYCGYIQFYDRISLTLSAIQAIYIHHFKWMSVSERDAIKLQPFHCMCSMEYS